MPCSMPARRSRAVPVLAVTLAVAASFGASSGAAKVQRASGGTSTTASATTSAYTFTRANNPSRTTVWDSAGSRIATFTDGSRTVALAGPRRRFTVSAAAHAVTSTTWIRVLGRPFTGRADESWLNSARADRSPDVLAVAMQFLSGARDLLAADGLLLAADASYGPLQRDGMRQAGADWNDFQGVSATYGTAVDVPEPTQLRSLDCSGFMRMLWGRRFGVPLGLDSDGGATFPRRAVQQAAAAPGIVPIADAGRQVTDLRRLQQGDLVFFDASTDDGTSIDHVGMYLGVDEGGRRRFVSSRQSADGPTMGDLRGASVLDGTGLYARSLRSTRRL